MEFEFNFGQQTLTQGIKKNETVYASVAGVALQLSNEELVFLNKETGKNHVMTHQVLQALSLCQQFKPLHEHIYSINQNMPELSNQVQAIEQVTQFLIKSELLIEETVWKNKLKTTKAQKEIKSSGIVIRSCDRPDQLRRLLQSLVKYQRKFNAIFPVQIYDDSTSEKQEKAIEEVCSDFKTELNINYYGRSWQDQFMTMLKTEFINNHDVIDWLLGFKEGVFTGGRVWNFALLNNAGKKFLFFDDDFIFEPRILNHYNNNLNFNDKPDLSVGFSLSLNDIRESSSVYEHDVLSEMLDSCGQRVGNWLSQSDVNLSSVKHLNLIELQRINADSVIKATGNGTWGSPRSNSNSWLYALEGEYKQEFWKSREVYLDNIEASNLMHYSEEHEFLSLTKFAPSAIDNSAMTPFASPTNRVEDHFFNAVSLYCYPDQVSLHYPFMMGHIQTTKRDRSSTNHIAKRPNINQFIADYALTIMETTDATDPQLRLKTLSNYVMGLADSSDKNIFNRLKEYLSQVHSDMVLTMQTQLEKSPDAPVYWQADVREIIEANGKAILENGPPIFGDWPDNLTNEQCVDLARKELIDVAKGLQLWPDIWTFCQTNK